MEWRIWFCLLLIVKAEQTNTQCDTEDLACNLAPEELDSELRAQLTNNDDSIPIAIKIFNESDPYFVFKHGQIDKESSSLARRYKQTAYQERLYGAQNEKYTAYYGYTDMFLRNSFAAHKPPNSDTASSRFAIIGSVDPWYETFAAVVGKAKAVIVIEYHRIVSQLPSEAVSEALAELYKKIIYVTPGDLAVLRQIYKKAQEGENKLGEHTKKGNTLDVDAVLSVSSLEHDGLGRYGDPIDAYGDFLSMANHRALLLGISLEVAIAQINSFNINDYEGTVYLKKQDDMEYVESELNNSSAESPPLLYLSIPVGNDCVVWNAHRIYGLKRLKRLFRGWLLIGYFDNNWTSPAQSSEEAVRRMLLSIKAATEQLPDCREGPIAAGNYQPVFVLTPRL